MPRHTKHPRKTRDERAELAAVHAEQDYAAWLRSNGIHDGPAPSRHAAEDAKRAQMERWYRLAEQKRTNAKHAPDPNAHRRALARAESYEAQGDKLFAQLNEPHVAGDPIIVNPHVCACGFEGSGADEIWTHRLSCWT